MRFQWYEMSTTGKSMETQSRSVVARGWGEEGMGRESLMGTGFPSEEMKRFWNLQ